MQAPELYHKSHKHFKQDTGKFITKYLSKFQWRNDGTDILLDLGTGPGDIFMNYIYPELPEKFDRAICADFSEEMLEFAKTFYKHPKKCEYRLLDITTPEGMPSDLKGKVHHLTATHLLHWIEDFGRGTVLKKMYDLLTPDGGDCLIIFMPHLAVFDVNTLMKKSPKWGHFLKDITEFVPISNYSPDIAANFRSMLQEAGFCNITIEEITDVLQYENHNIFKEGFRPVCGVLKYIPENLHDEFLNDCIAMMVDIFSRDQEVNKVKTKYCLRYKFIVAHAKKLLKEIVCCLFINQN